MTDYLEVYKHNSTRYSNYKTFQLFEVAVAPLQGAALTDPIKISKVQVKPSFVEAFLRKDDDIDDVVVIKMDLPFRQDVLIAFVVVRHRQENKIIGTIDRLRRICATQLDLVGTHSTLSDYNVCKNQHDLSCIYFTFNSILPLKR